MNIPSLEHAAIGRPITRLGFSLFPVYLPPSDLPPIATGPGSGLIVDELPNASVPTLSVTNPTDRAILLIEGECLVGGAQNRTLNVSVLVPAGATLKIPVTCLEQGRWGSRRAFQHGSAMAPRRVRRTKQDAVAARLVTVGAHTRTPRRPGRRLARGRRGVGPNGHRLLQPGHGRCRCVHRT